jgi:hypothetical protein
LLKILARCTLAMAAFMPLGPLAFAAPSAQEILAASDAVRNPPFPFGVTITLTEYRAGKQLDGMVLTVYSKEEAGSGQFRNLVRFAAPARDVNKLMLKNGNDVWFFDPNNKATIRIPLQQRLLGQAANGDVVTVNLAKDYQARLVGEEDMVDGERAKRRCHKLDLKAVSHDVTYSRVEMWVDTSTNRPIKAYFYSDSDRLLKTAYYRRYENQLENVRPTETVIIDGLDPSWVTVMRGANYVRKDVPDAWFQRDFLPRFRPE